MRNKKPIDAERRTVMIEHIVFWKLAEQAAGNDKWTNARIIKQRLEALVGVIPGLLEARVGLNLNGGDYDAVLVSRFTDLEALHAYDVHPAHTAVRDFVTQVRISRASVDCEV